VLAIGPLAAFEDCEPKFFYNPLANLPKLKKLVIMVTQSDYLAPPKLLEACKAIDVVKCVYIDHCLLPLITVS
jgi:hypothetical protein